MLFIPQGFNPEANDTTLHFAMFHQVTCFGCLALNHLHLHRRSRRSRLPHCRSFVFVPWRRGELHEVPSDHARKNQPSRGPNVARWDDVPIPVMRENFFEHVLLVVTFLANWRPDLTNNLLIPCWVEQRKCRARQRTCSILLGFYVPWSLSLNEFSILLD